MTVEVMLDVFSAEDGMDSVSEEHASAPSILNWSTHKESFTVHVRSLQERPKHTYLETFESNL